MSRSQQLFTRAQQILPGGVNSPVRSFTCVGGTPRFITRAEGPWLIDVDQQHYIDLVNSWGAIILGHAHPEMTEAVQQAVTHGTSFGTVTEIEVDMAEKVTTLMPDLEMVRFVNSGTEATMTALRLARAYSGRERIIKFAGCYHGHENSLLVESGSGVATLGLPGSAGIAKSVTQHTMVAPFNDLAAVEKLFSEFGEEIAAVIVEPVAGNAGCLSPLPDFLPGLRKLCDQHHSVLIFDEVMTGFRVALGGAQSKYGVKPDITTLAKIIGGGFPVGAIGANRAIMELLAPLGPVYQAGTLSGNPVAMTAGLKALQLITADSQFHEKLTLQTKTLVNAMIEIARDHDIAMSGNVEGGMFGLWFSEEPLHYYSDIQQCDQELFSHFFHAMLDEGVYLPPSLFESSFLSISHDEKIIEQILEATHKAFNRLTG